MAEEKLVAPTPVPIAFLICDQTSQDVTTGKTTIVGVFSDIWAEQFPASHVSTFLYTKLIDCEGEYEFRIEFVQVATQDGLLEAIGEIASESRHRYTEFVLPSPPLPLPAPGEYEFRLWMNNKFISSVRVWARPLTEMEHHNDN